MGDGAVQKTRRELVAEAQDLGRELGVEVETDRKNHAALTALVAELRAALDGQEETVPTEPPPPEPAPQVNTPWPVVVQSQPSQSVPLAEPESNPRAPYYVAPGHSTVVNGRVVGPGKAVSKYDFERGQADLDYLVERGVVIKS